MNPANFTIWLPLLIGMGFLVFLYMVWQRYTVTMDKLTKPLEIIAVEITDGD